MTEQTNAARLRELNETIRYTMWSVYRATSPLPSLRENVVDEVESLFTELAGSRTRTCGSAAPRWAGRSPRSGRRWRCTVRPSSTRATSRRS